MRRLGLRGEGKKRTERTWLRAAVRWAPVVEHQRLLNPLPLLLFGKGVERPAIFPSVRMATPEPKHRTLGPCRLCRREP